MRLEDVQVELRPRAPYEAMDLGLKLLRHFARPVYRGWASWVWSSQLLIVLLGVWWLSPGWVIALLWWLKPLYDRVVLVVLGRGLFGDPPTARAVARALFSERIGSVALDLTLRRLSPVRSVVLPVTALEGLAGERADRRREALTRSLTSPAQSALFVCAALELAVVWALGAAVLVLAPEEADLSLTGLWHLGLDADVWLWLMVLPYVVAVSVIRPIYVAAGFGLYLNRRTQLEGWDVELAFRRLANRLAALRYAAVCLVVMLGAPQEAVAEPEDMSAPAVDAGAASQGDAADPEQKVDDSAAPAAPTEPEPEWLPWQPPSDEMQRLSEGALERVLAREDLIRRETTSSWELREFDTETPSDSGFAEWLRAITRALAPAVPWLAGIGQWLLWAVISLLLVTAVYYATRTVQQRLSPTTAASGASAMVRSLPEAWVTVPLEQVAAHALSALEVGEPVRALGLLYGGAIRALVERGGVVLTRAATEGECLSAVARQPGVQQEQRAVFERLTQAWTLAAYGHRPPAGERIRQLCEDYSLAFSARGLP